MTSPEARSQQLKLKSGRRLGFAEYGARSGPLVFYFHGWPSSRLEAALLGSVAQSMGLHLVAPDRPGYGLSDFDKGRTLRSWPEDVCELAGHFGASTFGVLGVSGGGPYALACGACIPERLRSLSVVCSVGPSDSPEALEGMVWLNRSLLAFARRTPWLPDRLGGVLLRAIWREGGRPVPPAVERRLPKLDKAALEDPGLRQGLIASSREALRQGTRAAAVDGLLLARDWNFPLEEIRTPVHLWHGERDVVVPPAMGRCLARRLPNCHATFHPEDGHFSLPYTRCREILEEVVSA